MHRNIKTKHDENGRTNFRRTNFCNQKNSSGNLSKQLKKAHKRNCDHEIVIGEDEITTQKYLLKNLASGQQLALDESALINHLKKAYGV